MKIDGSILITGGAGFIGSHIVDRLINKHNIIVYDNFSSGKKDFISHNIENERFKFIYGDLLDIETLKKTAIDINFIFHFASNANIELGTKKTDTDLKQGTIATYNVLETMRINDIKNILFPSSCTVYGETKIDYISEDYGPLTPISLYGASKLACESLISAYSHLFGLNAYIYRFANVVGSRATHGIIYDFIKKLKKNNSELEILGDGSQTKSYLYIDDCIDGMLFGVEKSSKKFDMFNLSTIDTISAKRIGEIVVEEMNLKNVKFKYTGSNRGWKGDIPKIMISIDKLTALGWKPKYCSAEAVRSTTKMLIKEV